MSNIGRRSSGIFRSPVIKRDRTREVGRPGSECDDEQPPKVTLVNSSPHASELLIECPCGRTVTVVCEHPAQEVA